MFTTAGIASSATAASSMVMVRAATDVLKADAAKSATNAMVRIRYTPPSLILRAWFQDLNVATSLPCRRPDAACDAGRREPSPGIAASPPQHPAGDPRTVPERLEL